MPRGKLRVAIAADTSLQPCWIIEAFSRVAASSVAGVAALIVAAGRPAAPPLIWRAYGCIDRWLFGSAPDPSLRMDLKDTFSATPVLAMPSPDAGDALIEAWRAEVKRLELDVVFALGRLDDAMLDGLAKHGVWRYWFGAPGINEEMAGVCEVAEGAAVTVSGLKARRGAQDERLLYQSWAKTNPFSVSRNRENVLRKSSEFALRVLRRVHRSGERWIERCRPLQAGVARGQTGRCGLQDLRGISKLARNVVRRALQKAFLLEQWCIGYRFDADMRWEEGLRGFRWLMPPKDRLWADPFVIERGGRYFVFFEELLFAERRAHIAMMELGRDGPVSPPMTVLRRDYHLSYPFLIESEGALYMVPETLENRTVELYRCTDFPTGWRLERVLIRDARCADASFYQGAGKWWMFVNVAAEGTEPHDELHIFHSPSLAGEWRAHHANPVKSDVRSARPAGRLFRRDGALYRPAQICAPLYGSGISLNRVLHLSPRAYCEREETRLIPAPDTGVLGIHTWNRAGELNVLDGFVRRRRLYG